MNNEDRIKAIADKGYILVQAFDGWEIIKKVNEAGEWTYYSNQIGHEGYYIMWDTAVQSIEELQAILEDLQKPANNIPEPLKTILEINAMVNRMRDYINIKLENTSNDSGAPGNTGNSL